MNRFLLLFSTILITFSSFAQTLDRSFAPNSIKKSDTGKVGSILTIATQSDGKVLVSGIFSARLNEQTSFFYRLNMDGSIDTTFQIDSTLVDFTAIRMEVQPDDKILVSVNNLVADPDIYESHRLLPNGALDIAFEQNAPERMINASFNSAKVLADGKIIIGGGVFMILNEDGTLFKEDDFLYQNMSANDIEVQTDGKILIAGTNRGATNIGLTSLIRLNQDFTFDLTFPQFSLANNFGNATIKDMTILSDGTIAMCGFFSTLNGVNIPNNIAFINPDGTIKKVDGLDVGFQELDDNGDPRLTIGDQVFTLPNDLVLLKSPFGNFQGQKTSNGIILDQNGQQVNSNFTPITSAFTAYYDEKRELLYLGDNFSSVDGHDATSIVRYTLDGLYSDSLELSFAEMDTCLAVADNCQSLQTFQVNLAQSTCAETNINWQIASDGTILADGTGNRFEYEVDLETAYEVTFMANDTCGNQAILSDFFTFTDCQGPNVEVNNNYFINWDGNDFRLISAGDLITQLSDNCTDSINIIQKIIWGDTEVTGTIAKIEALPDTLAMSCNYLGRAPVKIIVADKNENIEIIETTFLLQDLTDLCPSPINGHEISGKVIDDLGRLVTDATINYTRADESRNFTTNTGGTYSFLVDIDTLPVPHTITASKTINPLNGVSTFDLLLMRQHILGTKLFDSPAQYLAADINNSKSITTFDIVTLSKMILGITPNFSDEQSWLFVQADYEFMTNNPLTEDYPTAYNLQTIDGDFRDLDFLAVKKGDLNFNAQPNNYSTAEQRTTTPLSLTTQNQYLQKGKAYKIPFSFPKTQPLAGFQLSIQTKDLLVKEINGQIIEKGTFSSDNIHSWLATHNGLMNINWLATTAEEEGDFELVFQAQKPGYLQDLLQLNQHTFTNEGYSADLETMDLVLDFQTAKSTVKDLLISVSPNPIRLNHALLTIKNVPKTNLFIKVYNTQGQLVQSYQEQFNGGDYQQRLELPDKAGTYWAHVFTGDGHLEQVKLIKL